MGELIQLTRRQAEPSIRQVTSGVFLLDEQPTDELLQKGDFFTALHFATAGERAGKSGDYGQGVMRDIALKTVIKNSAMPNRINQNEHSAMREISRLMNNPNRIRRGSRNLLLLSQSLVHDVWALGEGSELVDIAQLPKIGKVGHEVVSQLFVVK